MTFFFRRRKTHLGKRFAGPQWIALCLLLGLGAGCQGAEQTAQQQEAEEPAPEVPFSLSVDEKGVLYTWVKEDGSFHIAEKLAEIPEGSRKQVRVVVDGEPPGTPTHVFVADLSSAQPGQTVQLSALGRDAWEARGLKYRHEKIAPLEPPESGEKDDPALGEVSAVIYGADWCQPCHQAENYLKKKGVRVVKKNIEENPNAAREMREKLRKAGIGGSSIPILDVGGTLLVGFSPRAIDAALKRAH